MKTLARIVRIFLASPGDLGEERRLIKETEDELNSVVASHLGFRIELKGWEDTISGVGRPQSIINQELDLCELFIGVMYKRWGSAPSRDGRYTSGFEEEFERSLERRANTGKPEIALYFKKIAPEFLTDPGSDLQKVQAFRDRIKDDKTILYEEFSDPYDLQRRVRLKIQKYLAELARASAEEEAEEQAGKRQEEDRVQRPQDEDASRSLFSSEGHKFLTDLLQKAHSTDSVRDIETWEIARFRLLANVLKKAGNDSPRLGVHDANIVFENKQRRLGPQEINALLECGLQHMRSENVPIWHWYKAAGGSSKPTLLHYKTLYSEDVAVGALEAMRLIGDVLADEGRQRYVGWWLQDDASEDIKLAALRYLKHHGKSEDLDLVEMELKRANTKTSRASLEAIISIQLRDNRQQALTTAFTNQFETFDELLLRDLLATPYEIGSETLVLGLKHSNKRIRLESVERLHHQGNLTSSQMQTLKADPDVEIRARIVEILRERGEIVNDEEAKNTLVKPRGKRRAIVPWAASYSELEGQEEYEEYLFSKYYEMKEQQLLDIVSQKTIEGYDIAYFAMCKRYFRQHADDLRRNVDDRFREVFESVHDSHVQTMNDPAGLRDLEEYLRKEWTRKGLDILCEKRDVRDLIRIRENMTAQNTDSSRVELDYFARFGEWIDVQRLVNAKDSRRPRQALLLAPPSDREWSRLVADAAYNIGRSRLDELLNMDMPYEILVNILRKSSSASFSELADSVLLKLLNNRVDTVRKATALKCTQCLAKARTEHLLKQYIDGEEYRYYNVRVWLDLGVGLPRSKTKGCAKMLLNEVLGSGM